MIKQSLRNALESDPAGTAQKLCRVLEARESYLRDGTTSSERLEGKPLHAVDLLRFDVYEAAESLLGREWLLTGNRRAMEAHQRALEAGGSGAGAVGSTAFAEITSQLLITMVWEGLADPRFIADQVTRTVPTDLLHEEKIPGAEALQVDGTLNLQVNERGRYQRAQFGERYVTTPDKIKRGLICALTRELILGSRGAARAQILNMARSVGFEVRYSKEIRCLEVMLGVTNPYNENGVALNTYYLDGDTHPFEAAGSNPDTNASWINKIDNQLTDHTSVNTSLQLFRKMTNPGNGRRTMVTPDSALFMPAKEFTSRIVFGAQQVRDTNGSNTETLAPTPVGSLPTQLYVSELAHQVLLDSGVTEALADEYFVHFNRSKAFGYLELIPPTVVEAPANHPDEFEADIVQQVKAMEYGAATVLDPRSTVLNYDAA